MATMRALDSFGHSIVHVTSMHYRQKTVRFTHPALSRCEVGCLRNPESRESRKNTVVSRVQRSAGQREEAASRATGAVVWQRSDTITPDFAGSNATLKGLVSRTLPSSARRRSAPRITQTYAVGGGDGGVGRRAVGVQHDDAAIVDDVVELGAVKPQPCAGRVQLVRNGESPAAVAQPASSLRCAQTFSKAAMYWSTSSGTSFVK